ncbi:hypothetical protein N9543_04490 [Flavobacteriaceae bacterium]|nr:hypothetical protein [Flavobacteriaceae bacterium]
MKKLLLLLLFIPLVFTSCSTLDLPKWKKTSNLKEFVISKYGEPNLMENQDEFQVWKYESNNILKNNRTIVFKENIIISHKKKLKTVPFIVTNLLMSYVGGIVINPLLSSVVAGAPWGNISSQSFVIAPMALALGQFIIYLDKDEYEKKLEELEKVFLD